MLKTKDFVIHSDKKSLLHPVSLELDISKTVFEVFEKIYNPELLYRSTGVYFANLNNANIVQTGLFDNINNEKFDKLSISIDKIEAKFGKGSIKTGFV